MLEGSGGALLPGLADHHLHLFAVATAESSVNLSSTASLDDLVVAAERARPKGDGVRAVGWDDARHGDLDRHRLDQLVDDVPVRVQHRSGALWVLNSAALALLDLTEPVPEGAEQDHNGRLTGRMWRMDAWLRGHVAAPPQLQAVGARLARLGITAVTDASPDLDAGAVEAITNAMTDGTLPQRVQLLGADAVTIDQQRLTIGPRKVVIADHELPNPDLLARIFTSAHEAGRAVAVHCVSRAALALTIAALRAAGPHDGDRIEHCAIADLAAVDALRSLGVVVVTQPSLVASRGGDYLDRHDVNEHDDLWRYRSLLDHGVRVVPSSDAPYGELDPWATIRAATTRRTGDGRVLGDAERVDARDALDGMLTSLADPAGPLRRVAVGEPADLILLRQPLDAVLTAPYAETVAATIADGHIVYRS